jgi:NAD(P)-dependent dehydrogenase (short-subunit alcohol dehydrogenase family)
VTGGASGIGADIVRAFVANDAQVAFIDIQEDVGHALAEEAGALFLKCDITDIEALRASIAKVKEVLGPIGILVNNAANDDRHKIDDVTVEYWDKALDVNLRHQFFASQAVRPHMKELGGGAIINFSSIAWKGGDVFPAYAASKAGVLGLTRALSRAFGADNIRVNAIEPGAVITDRQLRLWYNGQQDVDNVVSRQAIQRKLVGADIARVVLFLASDDSEMIDRQAIIVDGGLT